MTTLEAKIAMKMHLPVYSGMTYPYELNGARYIKEIHETLDPIDRSYTHSATIYADGTDYIIKIDDACHNSDFLNYLKQVVNDYIANASVESAEATIEIKGRASSTVKLKNISVAAEYEKLLSDRVNFYKNEDLKKHLRSRLEAGQNKTQIIQEIRALIEEIKEGK